MFSTTGWAELKLGVRQSRSEQKAAMYVENILKKMKTGTSVVQTRVDAGAQEMKN